MAALSMHGSCAENLGALPFSFVSSQGVLMITGSHAPVTFTVYSDPESPVASEPAAAPAEPRAPSRAPLATLPLNLRITERRACVPTLDPTVRPPVAVAAGERDTASAPCPLSRRSSLAGLR